MERDYPRDPITRAEWRQAQDTIAALREELEALKAVDRGFVRIREQIAGNESTIADLRAQLEELQAECDAVGIPLTATGLVRHHRGNAMAAQAADDLAARLTLERQLEAAARERDEMRPYLIACQEALEQAIDQLPQPFAAMPVAPAIEAMSDRLTQAEALLRQARDAAIDSDGSCKLCDYGMVDDELTHGKGCVVPTIDAFLPKEENAE